MITNIVRPTSYLLSPVAFILLCAGCATTPSFHVAVDGYLNSNLKEQLQPGAVVYVLEPKNSPNPLLDQRLREQIQDRLREKGFKIGPLDEAAWCLAFQYGTTTGQRLAVDYAPAYWGTYPPVAFRHGYGYWGSYWGWGGPYWGPDLYSAYTYLVYHSVLDMRLFQAADFREKGTEDLLWMVHAWSRSESPDMRAALAAVLSVIFDYFDQDTLTTVERKVALDDPGVVPL